MSNLNLSINEHIGHQVEGTAEWRRMKAEQFPDDDRNLKAAEELERLAQEIGELEGSEIHRQIDRLVDQAGDLDDPIDYVRLNEDVSANLRSIGFHGSYENGAALLEWYRAALEELVRERIDDDDSDVPAPDLHKEIENDPAVRAAKQQYEEARVKAYATARKLL